MTMPHLIQRFLMYAAENVSFAYVNRHMPILHVQII
jgi:hypothetical protein